MINIIVGGGGGRERYISTPHIIILFCMLICHVSRDVVIDTIIASSESQSSWTPEHFD